MKFFIVDDNSYTRLTIKLALEKMGHNVIGEAEECNESVDKILKSDFDILLLDMLIKGGTGLDVLKKIKDKKVKVIAVTALEQDRVDEELKQLGVRYILRKPFSYEELKKVVESDL